MKILADFRTFISNCEIKIACKIGIAASLSLLIGVAFSKFFDRPDTLVSGLWSVMASIVVIQAYLGSTYRAARDRFLGVFVGSVMGCLFISYMGNSVVSLFLGILCTVILCALIKIKDSFRIACMSVAVIVVMVGARPDVEPLRFSVFRFLDSCIGIMVAVFVAYVVWPEKVVENLRNNIVKSLNLLSKYYRFATNLELEEHSSIQCSTDLESQITQLLADNHNYSEEVKLEIHATQTEPHDWSSITIQLEGILETIVLLDNVKKSPISKIFDDRLAHIIAVLIDNTDLAFQKLEKAFMTESEELINFDELSQSLALLNSELLRFRETRSTRKFNLEEVESFYVFFYSLRSVGESLLKINITHSTAT